VLIFHGYLLRGTGSNVYNAELARALVGLGHEVHLLCQERHPEQFKFVGAAAEWDTGQLRLRRLGDGGCTLYRPAIGALLPVYVRDRYEGVEARPFPELSDAELRAYLELNVAAVAAVLDRVRIDVALANHLVMGPAILARALAGAGVPYVVKIHGSALEYTVKPHPRFLPHAREGIAHARAVLVGSRHVAESLWATLGDPELPSRTRLAPPGVDVTVFRPRARQQALERLRRRAERMALASAAGSATEVPEQPDGFGRTPAVAALALGRLAAAARHDPVVAFVGKLILAKGVDLLLAAWPLVLAEVPGAQLAIVGFGAYGGAVEAWIEALAAGDLAGVRALAERGRSAEGGPPSRLRFVLEFLEWLRGSAVRERYLWAAGDMRARVILSGRLEHEELADVLAVCEAVVVPSTFPESFGMVAVEAAASGALPISAAHSGLAEVSAALATDLPAPVRELMSFPLDGGVVRALAARLTRWLRAPDELRQATRAALVRGAAERYSWAGVARGVIAAAQGELQALAPVSRR